MKKIFFLSLLGFILLGCSDSKIVTDPARILPILKEAQSCCDGHGCKGNYETINKEASCKDVQQFESCLKGINEECPLKGYGAF